jgi:hypothetical protein
MHGSPFWKIERNPGEEAVPEPSIDNLTPELVAHALQLCQQFAFELAVRSTNASDEGRGPAFVAKLRENSLAMTAAVVVLEDFAEMLSEEGVDEA